MAAPSPLVSTRPAALQMFPHQLRIAGTIGIEAVSAIGTVIGNRMGHSPPGIIAPANKQIATAEAVTIAGIADRFARSTCTKPARHYARAAMHISVPVRPISLAHILTIRFYPCHRFPWGRKLSNILAYNIGSFGRNAQRKRS